MALPQLEQVSHRGIASEAAALIREAIFDGRFAPGQVLREVELAAPMGVSRGSVREGLAQLEREGLVVTGWHRPSRVIPVTRRDATELYGLRTALDRLAAASAATASDQTPIQTAMQDLEAASRSSAELQQLLELDLRFHDAIYIAAGNSRLHQAWLAIRSQVQLFQTRRVMTHVDDYRERVVHEHLELTRLIASGPSEELDDYAVGHVSSALAALLEGLNE
jgi:DNA-binding GntR family transcriptional regulator